MSQQTPAAPGDQERELVQRAQAGDFEAFEALVEKHRPRLFTLALRIVGQTADAQEVVQETFLSAIENIDKFRGDSRFATWLVRIATNHALKILRQRQRVVTHSFQNPDREEGYADLPRPDYIAQWSETPDQLAERRETGRILGEAIEQLDEKHRVVFLLRDVEGFSTRETAETLGLTEANVKVRLLRARLALRELLTRRFGDAATRLAAGRHEEHG